MKLWPIILLLLLPIAAADCVEPSNGQLFTEDTVFCEGAYNLTLPLVITRDITIDCQDSTLFGGYTGSGIINSRPAVLKNCNIKGFEQGVVAEAPLTLETIHFEENGIAILSKGEEVTENQVTFSNNVQDKEIVIAPPDVRQPVNEPDPVQEEPQDTGSVNELLNLLSISSEEYAQGQNLAVVSRM
jgi:hypothetical protein